MIEFKLLAEVPDALPTIAEWLYNEWGYKSTPSSPLMIQQRLRAKMSLYEIPVHIVALDNNRPVGFIALRLHEIEKYTEREHWLGSLYVEESQRGNKLGSTLIHEVEKHAQAHQVKCLTLQTVRLDGGLYTKHGWSPVEQTTSHDGEVLIMEKILKP